MSGEPRPLRVVLCWHMHQPDYRGPAGSDFHLPWVYLHGIKDYVDMAYHLEEVEGARAVVNFTPTLLEQIDEYVRQIDDWLGRGKRILDPLLAALAGPGLPVDDEDRLALVEACRRANETHLVNPYPPYRELLELVDCVREQPRYIAYFNDQLLVDLLVWYHLAWMGESVRENDVRVATLESKARCFSNEDRRHLVELVGDQLRSIVPRYKHLAGARKVELTVTPHSHPIMPLLLDLQTARQALPDISMPELERYPGGEPRSRWHIRQGIEVFRRHFDCSPRGCWPAEGGVSDDTLRLLEEEGFQWAATGQQVLHNSLTAAGGGEALSPNWTHRPYCVGEGKLPVFFRDDGLSDLIGFTYGDWHADDAVGNFVEHLEHIAEEVRGQDDALVSIIMDGENAWEYYPRNGSYFLSALYQRLAEHPDLELTTYSDFLQQPVPEMKRLPRVVAGSWVYGTFSTWIGNRDKNRAWDMLGDAKRCFDRVLASGRLSEHDAANAERQLATCEGSDWFWWFGDYNPASTVRDFEQLYRKQLSYLYQILGEAPPDYLARVFSHGSGEPSRGGVMRQSN